MTSENTDSDSTSTGGGTPDFKKIDKIVFRYSLDGLREDMKRLYEDEGQSYRNIKQYVNKRILETELERRGRIYCRVKWRIISEFSSAKMMILAVDRLMTPENA